MRRQQSFADLGFRWTWKNVPPSIILVICGRIAFFAVYQAIYFAKLTALSHQSSSAYVSRYLFGYGINWFTLADQFLNPFFEELIVRAYLMTEITFLTNSASKAILISTALQTSYHFYQGAPAAIAHGATFLIYSIYYARTNRIGPIVLAHLYVDVGYTFLYIFQR